MCIRDRHDTAQHGARPARRGHRHRRRTAGAVVGPGPGRVRRRCLTDGPRRVASIPRPSRRRLHRTATKAAPPHAHAQEHAMTDPTRPSGPRPLPGQEASPVQRGARALVGVVAVVAVGLAAVLARPALADGPPIATPQAGVAAVVATGHTTEVTVTIEGMAFSPSTIEVPAGDDLRYPGLRGGDG